MRGKLEGFDTIRIWMDNWMENGTNKDFIMFRNIFLKAENILELIRVGRKNSPHVKFVVTNFMSKISSLIFEGGRLMEKFRVWKFGKMSELIAI